MAYKTVLVHFNELDRAEAVLQAGIGIARAHQAHLIGLYVVPRIQYFYAAAEVQIATEIFEAEEKFYKEQGAAIKAIFEREVPNDLPSEWRLVEGTGPVTVGIALKHAVCADIVVTGQINPERGLEGDVVAPERLVMESGRPVLVVPYAGQFTLPPKTVMVAWNATREAARAAFDALPLLKSAKAVKLLWINPPDDEKMSRAMAGTELASALSRQGVKVEAMRSVGKDIGIGDELLSRAADHGADMIVMGAYGHSRLREYVFGGATQHMLQHMTVPVLLSH